MESLFIFIGAAIGFFIVCCAIAWIRKKLK
jgi:hypothetical protein